MTSRLLVTGPRRITDVPRVEEALGEAVAMLPGHVVLVHGSCPTGVDAVTDRWGRQNAGLLDISVEPHPAQRHPTQDFGPWPGAGPRRNAYMASLGADRCLAFIAPCEKPSCRRPKPHVTHGTDSCVYCALSASIPVEMVCL